MTERDRTEPIDIRATLATDSEGIIELCRAVYPASRPWTIDQLASHLTVFPEGQLVAALQREARIVGMAASLMIRWDEYDVEASWPDVTDRGRFTNHDPTGKTLYGAEIMVHPAFQRRGIGKQLYAARRQIARSMHLKRIRAGARLRGYHQYADQLSAEEYVIEVIRGSLHDPTLSFQLHEGFEVFGVVHGYLRNDPESHGYAALIEWLNPEVATATDSAARNPRFRVS